MRLLSYSHQRGLRAGIAVGDRVVDAAAASRLAGLPDVLAWESVRHLVAVGPVIAREILGAAEQLAADGAGLDRDEISFGPPIPDPGKVICLGLNYADHAAEVDLERPAAPVLFSKYPNALVGHGQPIVVPDMSTQVDYEAELAVVIGRACRDVAAEDALDVIAGYMVLNDVSARDVQFRTSQWLAGKSFDSFAPCGPEIVTADEVDDVQNLAITTSLNGESMQSSNTRHMIFDVATTVAYVSSVVPLLPGDIIATGTPDGIGYARDPQRFLRAGDQVEVSVDSIGVLSNPVVAAALVGVPS